jgi:hypothetical protein
MRYSQTKGHKMSVVLEGSSTPVDDLGKLGYKQELHRKVGPFGSFAAGFSFVSILTTVFQLFWLGFGFGGAAFFWTWPAVFAGQLLVALVFSELAARYPISVHRLDHDYRPNPYSCHSGNRTPGSASSGLERLPDHRWARC